MAFSSSDLAALERAIKSGVQEVQYSDGTRVRYASLESMMAARDRISREADLGAGKTPTRRVKIVATKDL